LGASFANQGCVLLARIRRRKLLISGRFLMNTDCLWT
jgi:hypothetical protein